MDLANRLAVLIGNLCNALALPVSALPWVVWLMVGTASLFLLLVGTRLKRVVKPSRPYLSPLVRGGGASAKLIGQWLMATWMTWMGLELVLLWVYQALNGWGLLDATISAWSLLWACASHVITAWLAGSTCGTMLALFLCLRIIPKWERGDMALDARQLIENLRRCTAFDPRRFFTTKQGCFLGLEVDTKTGMVRDQDKAVIPQHKLRETHVQVLGTTGSGKGVVLSSIAAQCVQAGECVVWFDPKGDRYSPRILQAVAKEVGRPFYLIDLHPEHGAQLNPMLSATAHDIQELFEVAFDLRSTGSDGDFYRGKDQDAAAQAARVAVEIDGANSIPGLYKACASNPGVCEQENFWRQFGKLASLPAVNTAGGLDLEKAIAARAVIYINGSAGSERVKMLQKLLLVRILQILQKRDRLSTYAPVCVVLDEFKHMLSPAALTGLGVVRDFDVHFLLAHQSMGDLRACPGIEPAEAEGAVVDNTAIKIVFKTGDPDYAAKLSLLSGTQRIYREVSPKEANKTDAAPGSWREDEASVIPADVLMHLPMPSDGKQQASVGAVFGLGDHAKLFYVGPIPIDGPMPSVIKAEPYGPVSPSAGELI